MFDREDYVKGMEKVLSEKYIKPDGEEIYYYQTVTQNALTCGLKTLKEIIADGLEKEYLKPEEAEAMIPSESKPGRLYGLAKDHKDYDHIPPFRPIVSGSGSLTENISKFVDFHAKPLVTNLPSFIEDTPDLLRAIEDLKQKQIPENAVPVTIDVVGLYSNIPQEEAIEQMKEALDTREEDLKKAVPTSFLIELLTLVLTLNIFTFDSQLFIQLWGVAMGTRSAPTIANIFMGAIEKKILNQSPLSLHIFDQFWRRFIDDVLLIWTGSEIQLKEFLTFINSLHPTIKFTANYNFETCSVPFLDTTITIRNGEIVTDLYRKPTHSPQYLLPSSTHPPHCVKNIPFSLAYRIRRICSDNLTFEMRLDELKQMLLNRNYPIKIIEEAFTKTRKISRIEAIKRVTYKKSSTNKVTFVIPFDPRLPKISEITRRHFDLMKKDPLCAKIFEEGAQIAYKRHQNIRDILCRATLPPVKLRSNNREEKGWKVCSKVMCHTCAYSQNITEFSVTATGEKIKINQKLTCTDKNVIYCIQCKKCNMQYVGKTITSFKKRATAHRLSVNNAQKNKKEHLQALKTNQGEKIEKPKNEGPVGEHFAQKNHSISDMFFFAIEKVVKDDPFIVGARERFYIDKMDVLRKGINKNRTNK